MAFQTKIYFICLRKNKYFRGQFYLWWTQYTSDNSKAILVHVRGCFYSFIQEIARKMLHLKRSAENMQMDKFVTGKPLSQFSLRPCALVFNSFILYCEERQGSEATAQICSAVWKHILQTVHIEKKRQFSKTIQDHSIKCLTLSCMVLVVIQWSNHQVADPQNVACNSTWSLYHFVCVF